LTIDFALDFDWSSWSLSELDESTWYIIILIINESANGIAGLIDVRGDVGNDRGAVLLVSRPPCRSIDSISTVSTPNVGMTERFLFLLVIVTLGLCIVAVAGAPLVGLVRLFIGVENTASTSVTMLEALVTGAVGRVGSVSLSLRGIEGVVAVLVSLGGPGDEGECESVVHHYLFYL